MENGINIWSCLCVRAHAAWFIYCGVTCRLSQMPLSGRSSPCSTRAVSASSPQTTKNVISQVKPRWNKDETFPFQILSGIRPDSPFASTPVSTLCECTWCVVLSVYNLWCVSEGKSLKDEDVLQHLPVGTTATFYFRDLGAQISWVTVSTNTHCAPKRVTVEHQQSLQSTYCTSHHQHGYIQCLPWLEKQCVCLHTHICYVWGILI